MLSISCVSVAEFEMKQDVGALLHDKKTHTRIRRGATTDELIEPEISFY